MPLFEVEEIGNETLKLVKEQKERANQSFEQMKTNFFRIAREIWEYPIEKGGPQAVVDAWGAEAQALFGRSNATAQYIGAMEGTEPPSIMPEGWKAEPGPDGTMKLTPPPAPEPEPEERERREFDTVSIDRSEVGRVEDVLGEQP